MTSVTIENSQYYCSLSTSTISIRIKIIPQRQIASLRYSHAFYLKRHFSEYSSSNLDLNFLKWNFQRFYLHGTSLKRSVSANFTGSSYDPTPDGSMMFNQTSHFPPIQKIRKALTIKWIETSDWKCWWEWWTHKQMEESSIESAT